MRSAVLDTHLIRENPVHLERPDDDKGPVRLPLTCAYSVGDTGLEPMTSTV